MKNGSITTPLKILFSFLFLGLTYFLGYQVERTEFPALISAYASFFLLYLLVFYYTSTSSSILYFTGLGVLLRFLLIFAFPNLSDDIYRFIWDGHLLINGRNPFDHLPSYYLENEHALSGLTKELYDRLNSPNYFTIYPPVNQFLFATATYFSPNSFWGASVVLKSSLFLMEIGSLSLIIKLLKHFQLPSKNVLLYALNPLILLEIMGNVHFEGAMIFFFLLGSYLLLVQQNIFASAIAIALSIASKLLPLIFLPFFISRLSVVANNNSSPNWWKTIDWKRNILFFGIIGITLLFLFLPLFSGAFLSNFGASLNLYFQKFEFNASLYYVLRWLGFQYKGYNIIQTIGPILSIFVLFSILGVVIKEQQPNWRNLFDKLLLAICLYLFLAMTIHPWYVALPIVCCLFTTFRFPILWSGLIFLTYINYSTAIYQENLWIVGLEYLLVGSYILYELKHNRTQIGQGLHG